MEKYETEKEISDIVRDFETATISRENWRHAEHLTVALFYLSCHDDETAYRKMRDGIFNLLRAFEVDLTKEMPYHETLTIFWLKTVQKILENNRGRPLAEIRNEIIGNFDKDYPLKFYSRERLFSDEARAAYIEADLQKF